MFYNKKTTSFIISVSITLNLFTPIFAINETKYCDFGELYLGKDKLETLNRKVFNFNSKINRFLISPINIIWTSVMPQYGIDRIQSAYNNIEYPKRFASCILQKDFKGVKSETARFLVNSTIGLGGMFDPAIRFLKIKPLEENLDQALCHCKIKSGSYIVLPFLSSSSLRSILARVLELAIEPSIYLASPLISIIKGSLVMNKLSYIQPMVKMVESNYADPYEISKKIYGIDSYIKNKNLDRKDLLSTEAKIYNCEYVVNTSEKNVANVIKQVQSIDNEKFILGGVEELMNGVSISNNPIIPDVVMENYSSQSPVVDSLRTILFEATGINKSIWNKNSLWNRSFAKKIKSDSLVVHTDRDEYNYRYILQKDKKAPLAIFYPSIGEGVNSHHSEVFAKIFYDNGYSVLIQGSHFQWEFAKSMPENYRPGLPFQDVENLKLLTRKIIEKIEDKENCEFKSKILVGTSFGGMMTLFMGDSEYKNNTLNIEKFIAISPPIELVYAIQQVDDNSKELYKNQNCTKERVATIGAKVLQFKDKIKNSPSLIEQLPFNEEEGKLIVSFIMRQKLSDLVFTIENGEKNKKSNIYDFINNLSYKDYAEKYLLSESGGILEDLVYDTSLFSVSDYLKTSNNYKIYESIDDFLINKNQLEILKSFSPNNIICLNNGSHLGFLYRKEFQDEFIKDIKLN